MSFIFTGSGGKYLLQLWPWVDEYGVSETLGFPIPDELATKLRRLLSQNPEDAQLYVTRLQATLKETIELHESALKFLKHFEEKL